MGVIHNHPTASRIIAGGTEPPDNGHMDHEKRISDIERVLPTLATKADIAEVRADIHKAIGDNAKWLHTAMLAMFSAFVLGAIGLLFTIWNASKQIGNPPAQPTPIIIQIPSSAPVDGPWKQYQTPPPK